MDMKKEKKLIKVIDSLTMNPIEYTSISIFNLENQLITGGISNAGGEYEYHDNFYRMGFVGGDEGWTAEEILGECERYGIDLEDYKLDEEE